MYTSYGSPAKTGVWTDYTTNETYRVETAVWVYALIAFLGVWLSFSAKHLKQIITNFALYIHIKQHKESFNNAPSERTPLVAHRDSSAQVSELAKRKKSAKRLAEILKNGGGVRDFVVLCFDKDLSGSYRFRLIIFTVGLAVATVGLIFGCIFLTRMKANGPALLDSKRCGLWVFDRNSGGAEAATRAGIRDLQKESRAGEYAQNCYGVPDMFDAMKCNFLYQSRLLFSHPPHYPPSCPFQNEICGQHQTVTFTTDTLDASSLGINSQKPPKFRRRTSCTPLSMEYPFIRNETHNGTTTYYYYYGEKPLHDPPLKYTYTTIGDPFDELAPAYNVFAYISSSTPTTHGYWKPRAELTHQDYSTITIIFVSSLHILYKKWSDDPIFPANKEVFLPGEEKPWFRNSDPRARPLACVDFIEVCVGDDKWWPLNDPDLPRYIANKTISPPADFWLMFASLWRTNIYNAIEKRLGRGLIAQSKVSQFFSDALGDHHWVDEVERLVATSLAMTQINAWSIASGEDFIHEGKDGYTLITPESEVGNLCGKFKFNPPGYASIQNGWFLASLWSFPVFLILSRNWPFISWNNGDHESVRAAVQSPEAEDNIQEEPATGAAQRAPSTHSTTLNSEQSIAAQQNTDTIATDSNSEHVTATRVGGGVESRPSSADVANASSNSGQGRLTPSIVERISSHRADTESMMIVTSGSRSSDESGDTEWEPLFVGKVIELLVFIVWPGPKVFCKWLKRLWDKAKVSSQNRYLSLASWSPFGR